MISTALGSWNLMNSLSGGRLNSFVKKNIGKFAGKLGKKFVDRFANEKVREKLNGLVERSSNTIGKAFGEDSEIAKNAKNFSKELKGEHVETRSWNDGNKNIEASSINSIENTAPYSKNLGGSNYKRYIPKRFKHNKRVSINKFRVKNKKFK